MNSPSTIIICLSLLLYYTNKYGRFLSNSALFSATLITYTTAIMYASYPINFYESQSARLVLELTIPENNLWYPTYPIIDVNGSILDWVNPPSPELFLTPSGEFVYEWTSNMNPSNSFYPIYSDEFFNIAPNFIPSQSFDGSEIWRANTAGTVPWAAWHPPRPDPNNTLDDLDCFDLAWLIPEINRRKEFLSLMEWIWSEDWPNHHPTQTAFLAMNRVLAKNANSWGSNYPTDDVFSTVGEWFNFSFSMLFLEFAFEPINQIMALLILFISLLVQVFSFSYMNGDPFLNNFIMTLVFFTTAMLLFVMGNNLIIMFIGWELVGFASFLLINFWFTSLQAVNSGANAVIMNNFGDLGFMWLIALSWNVFGTLNISSLSAAYDFLPNYSVSFLFFETEINTLLGTSLLLAVAGNSAQLGLHTWLPDAMEGPTPVSALLHAATMVTAGIYLAINLNFFIRDINFLAFLTGFLGACTAVSGALLAIIQNDINKIVAYSTCSQLGYMFSGCIAWSAGPAFYHIINHAFFNATLFICCGLVIHNFAEQDSRNLGGLRKLEPLIYVNMNIANIALLGMPFFAGFYSNELILEASLLGNFGIYNFTFHSLWCTAFLSALYTLNLSENIFFGSPNFNLNAVTINQQPVNNYLIITILATLGIISGLFLNSTFFNNDYLEDSFFGDDKITCNQETCNEFIPTIINTLPELLLLHLLVNETNNLTYMVDNGSIFNMPNIYNINFGFDAIYNKFIVVNFFNTCNFIYENTDNGFLEFFGPSNIINNYLNILSQWSVLLPQNNQENSQAFAFTWLLLVFSFLVVI